MILRDRPGDVVACPVAIQVPLQLGARRVGIQDPPSSDGVDLVGAAAAVRIVVNVQLRRAGVVVWRASGSVPRKHEKDILKESLFLAEVCVESQCGRGNELRVASLEAACVVDAIGTHPGGQWHVREGQSLFHPTAGAMHSPIGDTGRRQAEVWGVEACMVVTCAIHVQVHGARDVGQAVVDDPPGMSLAAAIAIHVVVHVLLRADSLEHHRARSAVAMGYEAQPVEEVLVWARTAELHNQGTRRCGAR
mmetsp:Transcript_133035/g.384795  ORF Transcript_133035/g.384795 Transcript_133035/m.384795 type:complete len:249 (-) Transcript_133035:441-1187(-)